MILFILTLFLNFYYSQLLILPFHFIYLTDHGEIGAQLFSGSDDGGDNATVRVWDVSKTKKKNCIATLDNHRSAVTSLAISEDGWTLLSSGRDKVGSTILCPTFCFSGVC